MKYTGDITFKRALCLMIAMLIIINGMFVFVYHTTFKEKTTPKPVNPYEGKAHVIANVVEPPDGGEIPEGKVYILYSINGNESYATVNTDNVEDVKIGDSFVVYYDAESPDDLSKYKIATMDTLNIGKEEPKKHDNKYYLIFLVSMAAIMDISLICALIRTINQNNVIKCLEKDGRLYRCIVTNVYEYKFRRRSRNGHLAHHRYNCIKCQIIHNNVKYTFWKDRICFDVSEMLGCYINVCADDEMKNYFVDFDFHKVPNPNNFSFASNAECNELKLWAGEIRESKYIPDSEVDFLEYRVGIFKKIVADVKKYRITKEIGL